MGPAPDVRFLGRLMPEAAFQGTVTVQQSSTATRLRQSLWPFDSGGVWSALVANGCLRRPCSAAWRSCLRVAPSKHPRSPRETWRSWIPIILPSGDPFGGLVALLAGRKGRHVLAMLFARHRCGAARLLGFTLTGIWSRLAEHPPGRRVPLGQDAGQDGQPAGRAGPAWHSAASLLGPARHAAPAAKVSAASE